MTVITKYRASLHVVFAEGINIESSKEKKNSIIFSLLESADPFFEDPVIEMDFSKREMVIIANITSVADSILGVSSIFYRYLYGTSYKNLIESRQATETGFHVEVVGSE